MRTETGRRRVVRRTERRVSGGQRRRSRWIQRDGGTARDRQQGRPGGPSAVGRTGVRIGPAPRVQSFELRQLFRQVTIVTYPVTRRHGYSDGRA